jgi:hypothetical protein
MRFKYICHKSVKIKGCKNPVCICENPCSDNSYKCSYTYPRKNLRLFHGIPRAAEHWDNLCRRRTLAERSVNILKFDFGAARRQSFSAFSAKANLFLAGITQLITVIFAVNELELFKSVRKLIAA